MLYSNYIIMSVREIFDKNGIIDKAYLPDDGIPTIFQRTLISGNALGEYIAVGGPAVSAGNILATVPVTPSNPSGLAFQPGASISLSKGELITCDTSGSTVALPWPGSAANGYRLEVDSSTSTGIKWAPVSDSIAPEPPFVKQATVGGPPGTFDLGIDYTPNIKGQLVLGIDYPTGRRGALLNRPVGGNGKVLTVNDADSTFGITWNDPVTTIVQAASNANITVTTVGNTSSVGLQNPLLSTLNIGSQNITGTSGSLTFTNTGVTSVGSLTATSCTVSDTTNPGINTGFTEAGFTTSNASDAMSVVPALISKTAGATDMRIAHTVAGGKISLETQGGTSDITTNCALRPLKIKDQSGSGSVGTANQVLSAGPSGGSLQWVTPSPTPTLSQVISAGRVNTTGLNIDMSGNTTVTNLTSPINAKDAATKAYVDGRTLAQILAAGNSAGTSTINMNSQKITSLATPTDGADAATRAYVDGRTLAQILAAGNSAGASAINMNNNKITSLATPTSADDAATKGYIDTNFKVKQVSAGTAISVTETPAASGTWVIASTATTEPLATTLSAGNSAGSSSIDMNNNKITSLAAPAAADDAATKGYVDGKVIAYTALGQVQYAGAGPSFTPTNLSVGANGNVLTLAGGVPTWATPASTSIATAKCAAFVCGYASNVAFGNLSNLSAGPGAVIQIPFSTVSQTYSNDATITFAIDGTGRLQYTGTGQVVLNFYGNINYVTEQTTTIIPFPIGSFVRTDFVTPPGGGSSGGALVNSCMFSYLTKTSTSEIVALCAIGANNFQYDGVYNGSISGTCVLSQNDTVKFQGFSNSIWNFYGLPGQTRFLFSALPTTPYPLSDFSFTAFRLS